MSPKFTSFEKVAPFELASLEKSSLLPEPQFTDL